MGRKHKRKSHARKLQKLPAQAATVPPVIAADQEGAEDVSRSWITPVRASVALALLGLLVYIVGLKNQFVGDDTLQIVNNPVVHSISHIRLLFDGSTFYNGNGLSPLSGSYYRPLMSTVFSLIYTIFGANTLPYHLFQLLLCIGSATLLYLVFRYSFKPLVSFVLAAIFLVHPIDSQVVFAIASMQDALFFFFGILAFWLLLRFGSIRSLLLAVFCLILSLFAKEAAVLFIVLSLTYLFMFDRKRFLPFLGILALPAALYLILRIHAVGLDPKSVSAPIDKLGLAGRLFTMPSAMLFYFAKLVFPWKLASSYYWVVRSFSFTRVLLPFVIDLLIIYAAVYAGIEVKARSSRAMFVTYVFFGIWTAVGIAPYLQVVPLDMTACTTWFYLAMAGLLGMIGVILAAFESQINPKWFLWVSVALIAVLGFRTVAYGRDWVSNYTLAKVNIADSSDNFAADNVLAARLLNRGEYEQAKPYVQRSIAIYPSYSNYNDLGMILAAEGNYSGALKAYYKGLKYGNDTQIYNNLGELALAAGSDGADTQYLTYALQSHPDDYLLWEYLAVAYERHGETTQAKAAIVKAAGLGPVQQEVYTSILAGEPFNLSLPDIHKVVTIP